MKKFLYLICSLALVYSCSNIETDNSDCDGIITEIDFNGPRPQMGGETKTRYDNGTIKWSKGDNIAATYINGEEWCNKLYKSVSNPTFSSDSLTAKFKISGQFEFISDLTATFYALYPKSAANSTDCENGIMNVTIPDSQNPSSSSFDSSADLLFGRSEAVEIKKDDKATSLNVNITWTRLVAHGYFTFTGFNKVEGWSSDEEIQYVKITSDKTLAGTFTLPASTGNLVVKKGVQTITIKGDNIKFDSDGTMVVWFCSLPFEPTELSFEIITDKALYTKTYSGISGKNFIANRRNLLSVSMSKASRTPYLTFNRLTEVTTDGTYIILSEEKSKVFAGTATNNVISLNSNYTTLSNGVLSTYEDLSSYYLSIASTEDSNYYIKNKDSYNIGWTGNSSASIHVSTNKYSNTIAIDSSTGIATITSNPYGSNTTHGIFNYNSTFKYTAVEDNVSSNVAIYQLSE